MWIRSSLPSLSGAGIYLTETPAGTIATFVALIRRGRKRFHNEGVGASR